MPLIYRAMRADPAGRPKVGASADALGVREPGDPSPDIGVDDNSLIVMDGRGMSVASHWRHLPPHRIPKRLADSTNGANGSNSYQCWRHGGGAFVAAQINAELQLALKASSVNRGNICPARKMPVRQLQDALAATLLDWAVDES